MVDDRETKSRYRADHVLVYVPRDGQGHAYAFMPGEEEIAEKKIKRDARRNPVDYDKVPLTSLALERYGNIVAPAAKAAGTLTEPRAFNLMFITYVGAIQDDDSKAYLRPETAQGIFLNYKNVLDTMRVKVPFGVAQVGKSFRNEVTPRNFIFRSREFEQMEIEWFCHPDEARKWFDFWKEQRMAWWRSLGRQRSSTCSSGSTTKTNLATTPRKGSARPTSSTSIPSPPPISANWRASPTVPIST